VGNISSRVREKDMRRKFEKYGKIRRLELLRDFAFVDYEDPDDARDAIEGLDGYDMEGRSLQVALARSKGPGGGRGSPGRDDRGRGGRIGHEVGSGVRGGAVRGRRDSCVLVKNLSSKTGWQDLKDWARQCGAVEYADIWMDRGKKYGVIKFENKKDTKYAVEKLDDQYLDGRYVRVMEDTGGSFTASPSHSSSRSKSRSRSRSRKGKKSSKEPEGDEKKEIKEAKERSRSRSESPEKSNKRKRRSRSGDSDGGRKKKDKRKRKDSRDQSPEQSSSSSSSSSSTAEEPPSQ